MKHIKTITIPPLKGTKVIVDSKLFSYIDSDFKNWGATEKGIPTKEMKLDVFEMDKDARFDEMMSIDNLLTQEQILYFVENHRDLLRQEGFVTFFPFKSDDRVFVASVYVRVGGALSARVYRFSFDYVWYAGDRLRVVVPQLALNNSEPNPSDTLIDINQAIERVKADGYLIFKQI